LRREAVFVEMRVVAQDSLARMLIRITRTPYGATPWCHTVIFRRFEKCLILKDFCAVQ
jgi:hypothetical protein